MERIRALLKTWFHYSVRDLMVISDDLIEALRDGLKKPNQQVAMYPCYITDFPTGKETGRYFALDLGGSNFRALSIKFNGDGTHDEIHVKKAKIPNNIMTGRHDQLFGFIADICGDLLQELVKEGLASKDTTYDVGFTFSFPLDQQGLSVGVLTKWTKGFSATGVIGYNVVQRLQEQFDRRRLPLKCRAILNDTTGTMMAK